MAFPRSQRLTRLRAVAALVVSAFVFVRCSHENVTAPSVITCSNTTYILQGDPAYVAQPYTEQGYRGMLKKTCSAIADPCYVLDSTPIHGGGNAALLEPFVGTQILLTGKKVNLSVGQEYWPLAVCKFECDGHPCPS